MNDVQKTWQIKKILISVVEEGTFPVGSSSASPSSTSEEAYLVVVVTWPSFVEACTVTCGLGRLEVAFVVIKASSN